MEKCTLFYFMLMSWMEHMILQSHSDIWWTVNCESGFHQACLFKIMFFSILSWGVKMTELCVFPFSCQNVPPALLVRFLREHRSEWADFNVDAYSAASLKAGSYAYPGMRPTRFTGSQIIMPLGHTIEHEEVCHWMVFCPSFLRIIITRRIWQLCVLFISNVCFTV